MRSWSFVAAGATPGAFVPHLVRVVERPCSRSSRWSHFGFSGGSGFPDDAEDSDDERDRSSSASQPQVPVDGQSSKVLLRITFFVVYSPMYRVPTLFFDAIATCSEPEQGDVSSPSFGASRIRKQWRPCVSELKEWHCLPENVRSTDTINFDACSNDPRGGFVVSEGYCEELQRALFSVHPCDSLEYLKLCDEIVGPLTRRSSCSATSDSGDDALLDRSCTAESQLVRLLKFWQPLLSC